MGGCGYRVANVKSAAACVLLAAVSLAGCASVHNYLEPEGPRYVGGPNTVPAAPPRADGSLRVVSFNVAYAKQVPEAIAALRADALRGADVITLQEMDAPGTAAIAEALGLNYVYYPASRPSTGRDFGNAVLSPWPIEASHKVLLPGLSRGSHQARAAVSASVRVDGRTIIIYSVHLTSPWGMGGGGRARQVDAILADAATVADPVILAGDFNSHGVGERVLARGFLWPTRNIGHSIGPFSYDHVFVRGLRIGEGVSAGVTKAGPKASDHWPVWVVLLSSALPRNGLGK
jgi:endonuclease/exonuclease/phosphatase family metal-dependent hydrolase